MYMTGWLRECSNAQRIFNEDMDSLKSSTTGLLVFKNLGMALLYLPLVTVVSAAPISTVTVFALAIYDYFHQLIAQVTNISIDPSVRTLLCHWLCMLDLKEKLWR